MKIQNQRPTLASRLVLGHDQADAMHAHMVPQHQEPPFHRLTVASFCPTTVVLSVSHPGHETCKGARCWRTGACQSPVVLSEWLQEPKEQSNGERGGSAPWVWVGAEAVLIRGIFGALNGHCISEVPRGWAALERIAGYLR